MSAQLLLANMPTEASDDNAWLTWFGALKKELGKPLARQVWLRAAEKRLDNDANTAYLRDEMKKNGINLDRPWSDAILEETGDFISNPFGLGDTLKTARTAVAIVIVVVAVAMVLALIQAIRNPDGTLKLAAMFTPAGRVAQATKTAMG